MPRHYCTYFDRNYFLKGLALNHSLSQHGSDYVLWIVCLDEVSRTLLQRLGGPNVRTIALHEVERADPELLASRSSRSTVEYYWTMTASIILHILKNNSSIDRLTYLDSDMVFFNSPEPLFSEMGSSSVMIHPHRFPPHLRHLEQYGIYNVGLLSFNSDARGFAVLNWWREKCIEWCYSHLDSGRFGDQKYLDDWTSRFEGVHVLQHLGGGLAPWNHEQYEYTHSPNGELCLNGSKLIFYHYHGFHFLDPLVALPVMDTGYKVPWAVVTDIYLPYIYELHRNIPLIRAEIPQFSFGLHSTRDVGADHCFIAHRSLQGPLRQGGVNHPMRSLDNNWDLYTSPQLIGYPA